MAQDEHLFDEEETIEISEETFDTLFRMRADGMTLADINAECLDMGYSEEDAAAIAEDIEEQYQGSEMAEGEKLIRFGMIVIIMGLVITMGSYLFTQTGTYYVTIGAFGYGLWKIFKGINLKSAPVK